MHALVPVERLAQLLHREVRLYETMGEYYVLKSDRPVDLEELAKLEPGDTFKSFECMLSTEEFYASLAETPESKTPTDIVHDDGEEPEDE